MLFHHHDQEFNQKQSVEYIWMTFTWGSWEKHRRHSRLFPTCHLYLWVPQIPLTALFHLFPSTSHLGTPTVRAQWKTAYDNGYTHTHAHTHTHTHTHPRTHIYIYIYIYIYIHAQRTHTDPVNCKCKQSVFNFCMYFMASTYVIVQHTQTYNTPIYNNEKNILLCITVLSGMSVLKDDGRSVLAAGTARDVWLTSWPYQKTGYFFYAVIKKVQYAINIYCFYVT